MSEKIPKTILTDQDAAMTKAISHVMPSTTYHRFCTWHMMQNALKHVNGVFRGPGEVKNILSKFIDEIEEENQFLIAWNEMLEKYNAQNNNWLKNIFNIREKWASTYVRHVWSVGMKSTQFSENFNANLKDYLKSDFNVAQFFMHFERQGKFTQIIFKEFQDQFEEAVDLNLSPCVVDGESFFYIITDDHSREWQIKKEDNLLSCTCRMFEMKGFLCCHVIKVLRESMNIKEIPIEYILKRWTKQARGDSVQDINGREIQADPKLRQTFQYRSLCSIFTRISSRASENEKAYNLANVHVSNLAKQVEDLLRLEIDGNIHEKDIEDQDVAVEVECTQDPNLVKAKESKKKETSRGRRRFKSDLEKGIGKKEEVI
ncbi:hypothetical protein LWI28_020717 [Acer negundo]|uniref:Protein FAR1-RELATED SEQUENCE n=1 Tax=Acer negundo TaxID=4023 RepID=A0AAD5J6L7_ACENE|nr:hypothetical protein LWI28_020717 [Acer negundo]